MPSVSASLRILWSLNIPSISDFEESIAVNTILHMANNKSEIVRHALKYGIKYATDEKSIFTLMRNKILNDI